jgi:hypothetical protein
MKQIPEDVAKYICQKLGYDVIIVYGRKDGHDGGECVSYCGSSYKFKRMADEMVGFLKSRVFGWSDPEPEPETNMLGMPMLPEGPEGGDPDTGKRIISTALDKRGRR